MTKPSMKIDVNGVEFIIDPKTIAYEIIVQFAGFKPERILSVTYDWRGSGDNIRQGTLSPGRSVEPADGMRFDVADTSNA